MKRTALRHQFVKQIPATLDEGTLYISIEYATAVHRCLCGCGSEVVTPLSPTDWQLTFDGVTVSLNPSIGNWSYPCQSHYWIKRNKVLWDRQWSEEEIKEGRAVDKALKDDYYASRSSADGASSRKRGAGLASRLKKRWNK